MLIRVMYADGRVGMIKPHLLDNLLGGRVVTCFMRSDGWVVNGRDVIRRQRSSPGYDGVERREHDTLSAPFGRGLVMRLLQECAWVVGVMALVSILLSGLL